MMTFSQAQAQLARYWHERALYTFGPAALPAGPIPILTAQQWTSFQAPEWMAELTGLWVSQNPGVQLQWIYDDSVGNQSAAQGYTDAAPAGLRRMAVSAPAVRQLQLLAINTTGAPIANFVLNYEIAMHRLSVADKLLRGYGLSAQDERMLTILGKNAKRDLQDLVDKGTSPIGIDVQLERTVANRRLRDHSGSGLYHVSTASTSAFATLQAAAGEFLVLEEVAVEGGGLLAQPVAILVDRDQDNAYVQLTANAFGQVDDAPWSMHVPAVDNLTFRVASQGAPLTVPVRIRVGRYKLSNLLRARFGLARSPEELPGDLYAKAIVGLT
ncbi:MAG TPA: hypothetical protein VGK74_22225 [Symbiobacteriaceae bacterium]|jgi:hypothetical protein